MNARRFVLLLILVTAGLDIHAQTAVRQASVLLRRQAGLHRSVVAADFNNDGVTDLVGNDGTEGPSPIVIRLGRPDATFAAARAVAEGEPLAVDDFNNDGKLDLVARLLPAPDEEIVVFGGNGDGTFGAATRIGFYFLDVRVATADFDGDGNRDVVLSEHGEEPTGIEVALGNGDLSFDFTAQSRVFVPTGNGAGQMTVGDVNGDGRTDLVVANAGDRTLSVLINRARLLFARTDIAAAGGEPAGVALADVDRDGDLDLVASESSPTRVVVRLNAGNGTFATLPRLFDLPAVAAGAVALGDVNRDGLLDAVVTTTFARIVNDCAPGLKGINTVSVLPGRGDGTFAAGSTFALGDQANPGGWRGSTVSLQLADVSGDSRPDIVLGEGDTLVTTTPDPNWAPTVTLGPDAALTTTQVVLNARVSEVDRDAVTYTWQHSGGHALPGVPNPCVAGLAPGAHTFTVTVDDGQGHVASDSVTYTVPGTPPQTRLPERWSHADVGAVQAAGSATFDGTTFTVTGSGADIWGASDEFHWTTTSLDGDFDITTRVGSVENVNAWTKAGLMIRDGVGPSVQHASLFVTPGKGIAFQRRTADGGTSIHTAGPALTAPVWLKLTRRGGSINAYYRATRAAAWTLVGRQAYTGLATTLLAGLAVSSHVDGRTASATFTDVTVEAASDAGWSSADVGTVGAVGSTAVDGPNVTIAGGGADIWGTVDAFRFRYAATSTGSITARVRSVENTNAWAKAGVMMREDLTPGARHVMLIVSPGKGVAMQYRAARNGATANVVLRTGSAPEWVRLVREAAGVIAGFVSEDGVTWTRAGAIGMALPPATLDGLVVTSHALGTLATAAFDEVRTRDPGPLR